MNLFTVNGAAAFALLLAIWAHHFNAPFTKVEESFNLQAIHDMLFHGTNLDQYDHHEFPGVVPRSFLGAFVVANLSSAIVYPMRLLHMPKGFVTWLCLLRVAAAVRKTLGKPAAAFFLLVTASQPHLPFYASRTLPNTLALCLVSLAAAHWLDGSDVWLAPALLAATTVIFRCDMLLLTAAVAVQLLLTRRMRFSQLAAAGVAAGAAALAATVAFDSALWGRWLWPEGEVLWFNTVLNKSHEWGVMPWHWYFTSALPRALLAALPLSFMGVCLERRLRPFMAAILAFVVLYSGLGHKEVRFLFPVLPMFNIAAAAALARLRAGRRKNGIRAALYLGALSAVAASAALSAVFAWVSRHNYPGAVAVLRVNEMFTRGRMRDGGLPAERSRTSVHLCPHAAMTGVSRFLEVPGLTYSKDESALEEIVRQQHDFMITTEAAVDGYTLVDTVQAYKGLALSMQLSLSKMPVQLLMEDQLFILQKQPH